MSKRFFWVGLLGALVCVAGAGWSAFAEERVLSLSQMLELALKRNPSIEESRQQVNQAKGRLTQTSSDYWPQLSASTDYSRNYNEQTTLPGQENNYNQYTGGLNVTQNIYDFGRRAGKVGSSKADVLSRREQLSTSVADVVLNVKNGYFQVLQDRSLVEVKEDALKTQQMHLDQAEAFFKSGLRPKIDVAKAKLDVANIRLDLIKARYSLRNSRVQLEQVLGGPPVSGPYRLADVKDLPKRSHDLEPLIAEALGRRTELADLKAQLLSAEQKLKAAQSDYWPKLNAQGSYQYQNTELPLKENWLAGVELSLPIFEGFITKGKVSEARGLVAQIKAQIRNKELSVTQEVSQAFLDLSQADESITTSRVALTEAQENMALAKGRYRAGIGDAIEYSDAQVTLTEAESNLVTAVYAYHQAFASLARSLGRETK